MRSGSNKEKCKCMLKKGVFRHSVFTIEFCSNTDLLLYSIVDTCYEQCDDQ